MKISVRLGLASLLIGSAALLPSGAHALTAKECHQKFTAAKADGTLGKQSYGAFKAATCDSPAAASTPAPAAPADKASAQAEPAKTDKPEKTEKAEKADKAAPAAATASTSGAVFPSAVAAQYSKLSPGKARMQTCLDQYKANKAQNANGNMKWIQNGGGYYSECNKHLKG